MRPGWPATIEVDGLAGRFESCNVLFPTQAFRADRFDEQIGQLGGHGRRVRDAPRGLGRRLRR